MQWNILCFCDSHSDCTMQPHHPLLGIFCWQTCVAQRFNTLFCYFAFISQRMLDNWLTRSTVSFIYEVSTYKSQDYMWLWVLVLLNLYQANRDFNCVQPDLLRLTWLIILRKKCQTLKNVWIMMHVSKQNAMDRKADNRLACCLTQNFCWDFYLAELAWRLRLCNAGRELAVSMRVFKLKFKHLNVSRTRRTMLVFEPIPLVEFPHTRVLSRILLVKVWLHSQTTVIFTYHIVASLYAKSLHFVDIKALRLHLREIKQKQEGAIVWYLHTSWPFIFSFQANSICLSIFSVAFRHSRLL